MKRRKRDVFEELTRKATHRRSHIDEDLGDLYLEDYGREMFPNIKTPIEFWKRIDYDMDYEKNGCLLLGMGGGRFDEHRYDGKKGRGGCCASLVAKELDIQKKPELIKALRYVTDNDTKGKTRPFDMANTLRAIHSLHPVNSEVGTDWAKKGFRDHIKRGLIILDEKEEVNEKIEAISSPKLLVAHWLDRKFGRQLTIEEDPALKYILLYSQQKSNPENPFLFSISSLARDRYYQNPDNPATVEEWIDLGLEAKYREQAQFITVTKEEFLKNNTIERIQIHTGKYINIATVVSDDELIPRYARSREGKEEIAVLIQIKPQDKAAGDGFIQIHLNPKFNLLLDGITLAVRKAEQVAQGTVKPITDENLLIAEGTLRRASHWFRHVNNLGLYNGALSLTGPPSKLTREEVEECVAEGLQIEYKEYIADYEQMQSELEELIEC